MPAEPIRMADMMIDAGMVTLDVLALNETRQMRYRQEYDGEMDNATPQELLPAVLRLRTGHETRPFESSRATFMPWDSHCISFSIFVTEHGGNCLSTPQSRRRIGSPITLGM